MKLFGALSASASGLTAQRLRLDLIAGNLANANTTRTPEGGPYRRKMPVLSSRGGGFIQAMQGFLKGGAFLNRVSESGEGVRVTGIVDDPSPFNLRYEPGHPDANEDGYVEGPNVDVVVEMVDMISATRAYEANLSAIESFKRMAARALDIGRG